MTTRAQREAARRAAAMRGHHGRPTAGRRNGRPHSGAVEQEQIAINEALKRLYPPPANPRLLKVDGIAGTATNAMRELIDKAFHPTRGQRFTDAERLQHMKGLADHLQSPAGQNYRADNAGPLAELNEGMNNAREDRPGSGFQPGTGAAPDPSPATPAAPPVAGTPAAPAAATPPAASPPANPLDYFPEGGTPAAPAATPGAGLGYAPESVTPAAPAAGTPGAGLSYAPEGGPRATPAAPAAGTPAPADYAPESRPRPASPR